MDIAKFFTHEIPSRFAEDVAAARARLEELESLSDEESKRKAGKLDDRLDALEDTDVTLRVEITGDGGGDFFLNIESGELGVGDSAAEDPVVWVTQTSADFIAMHSVGMNAVDLVGGGKRGRIPNPGLADKVRDFEVTMNVVLEGLPDGAEAATLIRLGEGNENDDPIMTLRLALADVHEMIAGRLPPPQAFMAGKIRIEGDMSIAMKLASLAM